MNKQTLADIRFSFDHELIPHHLEGEDMMAFVNQINKNGESKMHCRGSLDKIEVLSAVSYVLQQAE